jgi:hypothetical protein
LKNEGKAYDRILNIEFKHGNAPLKDIAKDALKLMHEKENGAFIFLLKNTNKGSLNNKRKDKMGVLDKLFKSFSDFDKIRNNWGENILNGDKCIHLIIFSLERKKNSNEPALIYRTLFKDCLNDKKKFSINKKGEGDITTVSKYFGWEIVPNK